MLLFLMQGYGPNGLGIITVCGVPDYQQLRQRLLPLAQDFAVSTLAAGRLLDDVVLNVCGCFNGKCADNLHLCLVWAGL